MLQTAMTRLRLGVAGIALLIGCSSGGFRPLNHAELRDRRPQTIRLVVTPSPDFMVQGGHYVADMFGLAGALAAGVADTNAAERLTDGAPLRDPGLTIRHEMLDLLVERFSLQVLRAQGEADLMLDIRTTRWGVDGTGSDRYGVHYDGTLKLVDRRSSDTVAEGLCASHPVDAEDGPTFQQLMANDRALLRDELSSTAEFCTDDYRKRILNLY